MSKPEIEFSFDSSKEGPALVAVSFGGQSQMFQAYIRTPVIRKFQIMTPPAKREYLVGEKLDLTGLQLQAEYETGERVPFEDIPAVDYSVRQGDAVYPLSINGITVPIYIRVADASLVGIRMGKLPNVTEYLERKDKFNAAGGTIFKIYNSGVEQEIPLPYNAVRGFSNLTPGPQTLTVQLDGYTTSFDITIVEKKAIKLTVDVPPFRTSYTEGEEISMDGIRLSVEYNNGENRICEDWDYEPKVAKLNGDTVTVKCGDAVSQVAVSVVPRQLMAISVCKLPNKTQYRENRERLDITGAELELSYDYGEPIKIPIESDMVKGFDNRRAGECQVEVQYQGLAANFTVDILPQQLLGITITQMPEKLDYAPGEMFDKKGLVVSGFYDSGILEPLRSYAVEPDRPLTESDVAILISSMDKTAVIPIKVAEMFRPKLEQPIDWDTLSDQDSAEPSPAEPLIIPPVEQIPVPEPEPEPQLPATGPGFLPDPTMGFGIPPEPTLDMSPKQESEKKLEQKKSSFWGRRLFYPSISKYQDE